MNSRFLEKIKSTDRFELLKLYNKTDVYTVEALKAIEAELQKRELDFQAHDYAFLQQKEDDERGVIKINLEDNLIDAKPSLNLYSKDAIWGFSLIISPLFASVLFLINMVKLGKASVGCLILFTMIAYQMFTMIAYRMIANYIVLNLTENLFIGLVPNIIGGYLLANLFWGKLIGHNTPYQTRSLKTPILIALIMVLITAVYLYTKGISPLSE